MTALTPDEVRAASRNLSTADYPGTIRAYYPYWDALYRPFLLMAVEALPAEHFDFKPRPEMFTAHQTIVHIVETERAWIHSVVDGHPDENWLNEHQDPAQGWTTAIDAPDHAALIRLLEEWHRPTQRWLDRPAAELGRIVTRRLRDGSDRHYTLHWILGRVQEHEIHHRAQLNLYLRILGVTPPSM